MLVSHFSLCENPAHRRILAALFTVHVVKFQDTDLCQGDVALKTAYHSRLEQVDRNYLASSPSWSEDFFSTENLRAILSNRFDPIAL